MINNDYANAFSQQLGQMQSQNALYGLGQAAMSRDCSAYIDYRQTLHEETKLQAERIKAYAAEAIPKKGKSMFKEIVTDVRGFILEHRAVIYFIVFALMVDHFFFRGAFKARLQSMADRLVTKVEEKIQ